MRFIYISFILIGVFSCQKSKFNNFSAGDEKNMEITEVNEVIEMSDSTLLSPQSVKLDLDGRGIYDVSIKYDRVKRDINDTETVWRLYISVLNDNFSLYGKRDDKFVSYHEELVDSNPEAPIIEAERIHSCEPFEGAVKKMGERRLIHFEENAVIDLKNDYWLPIGNSPGTRHIIAEQDDSVSSGSFLVESYYYDTLIREQNVYLNNCQLLTIKNAPAYFIFKEISSFDGEEHIGWIEFELTTEKIFIKRFAYSMKALRI